MREHKNGKREDIMTDGRQEEERGRGEETKRREEERIREEGKEGEFCKWSLAQPPVPAILSASVTAGNLQTIVALLDSEM
jgi:hypothetical protein